MFSLRFTLSLLGILLIPYFFRAKYGIALEPYPAVMLPSGSGKVDASADIAQISYTTVLGRNATGQWSRVDNARLLYPIPIQYLSPILSKEFGLKEDAGTIRPGIQSSLAGDLSILWAKHVTEQDRQEVKAWLRGRLGEQHFDASVLKVVKVEEVIAIPDGRKLNYKVTYENTLRLDQ
ncbi:hypothetical protein ACFSC6_09990 [Rufibacter sediminis]|uniref:Uncharacterized protein n=1 Tax=Rufibacter sediminis TaxID=2762756 RepID=A0ABR6VY99_9BACT|nr:hypothetical protein [Rufibacter sediminis]MBC3541778.1 hypothetical protein [Rufibacter sediminis]